MRRTRSPRGVFERQITEEDIVKQITQFLDLNGFRVHRLVERIPWGKKTSTPGMPDLVFWAKPGAFIEILTGFYFGSTKIVGFCEVKKPGGKRRFSQERWIADANSDGVMAFFAESVEDVCNEFAKRGIRLRGAPSTSFEGNK